MKIIELQDVCKNYQMGKVSVPAVKGVSFSIEKGEFAAISGPSGSGKSTLLNIMGLIDLPTSGKVILNGQDIFEGAALPESDKVPLSIDKKLTGLRSKNVGFIFQTFNLVPVLNVWENVKLPLNINKAQDLNDEIKGMNRQQKEEWIDYLIERVGLSAWKKHKPQELSGGQRQRVAIARALVTKAPLIMADEPTANLDSKNGEQILDLMQKLNRELKTTFIFSTHDARIVQMCNHVIYLLDGVQTGEEKK